jgi:hypothetical protein
MDNKDSQIKERELGADDSLQEITPPETAGEGGVRGAPKNNDQKPSIKESDDGVRGAPKNNDQKL